MHIERVKGAAMRKHTTMNLDVELVREAQKILGTKETTETVHQALREVINLQKRRELLKHEFPGLTPESLEEMRREQWGSSDGRSD